RAREHGEILSAGALAVDSGGHKTRRGDHGGKGDAGGVVWRGGLGRADFERSQSERSRDHSPRRDSCRNSGTARSVVLRFARSHFDSKRVAAVKTGGTGSIPSSKSLDDTEIVLPMRKIMRQSQTAATVKRGDCID